MIYEILVINFVVAQVYFSWLFSPDRQTYNLLNDTIWHLSLSNEMEAVPRISMFEVKTKHSPDNNDFILKLKKLIKVKI